MSLFIYIYYTIDGKTIVTYTIELSLKNYNLWQGCIRVHNKMLMRVQQMENEKAYLPDISDYTSA